MKKFILFLFFITIFSVKSYATTFYACSGGGNWNGASVWTSILADEVGCTASTGNPVAGDTAILNSSSGNITITAAAAAAFLDETGYAGTLAFGTQTLTLTTGANLGGAMTSTSGTITNSGGTITLLSTPTGSFPTIKFTTASQTLTSGGFNWPGPVNFDFAGTFTFNGNWYTGGLTTLTLSPVLNHTTTETYTAAGGLSGDAAITGSLTQLYLTGGTWTTGGVLAIQVPMTITPSVSNITLSGICTFGGTSNTLTYTPSTYSVTTTGSTLEITTVTTAVTLNISGLTLNNLYINMSGTINLPTTLTLNGTFSMYSSAAPIFSGVTTINCANISFVGGSNALYTFTFPAGSTINVSNSIILGGALLYNTGGNAPITIKSGTATSPMYINYTGLPGNALVSNVSFTDVQFIGLPVFDYSQVSNIPTLTRTTNITVVGPANLFHGQGYAY